MIQVDSRDRLLQRLQTINTTCLLMDMWIVGGRVKHIIGTSTVLFDINIVVFQTLVFCSFFIENNGFVA